MRRSHQHCLVTRGVPPRPRPGWRETCLVYVGLHLYLQYPWCSGTSDWALPRSRPRPPFLRVGDILTPDQPVDWFLGPLPSGLEHWRVIGQVERPVPIHELLDRLSGHVREFLTGLIRSTEFWRGCRHRISCRSCVSAWLPLPLAAAPRVLTNRLTGWSKGIFEQRVGKLLGLGRSAKILLTERHVPMTLRPVPGPCSASESPKIYVSGKNWGWAGARFWEIAVCRKFRGHRHHAVSAIISQELTDAGF